MPAAWSTDIDEFRAIGHGALALFNMGILLAILAVLLSSRSATPTILGQAFGFLSWLVNQVVQPVTGGQSVVLSSTLAPASDVATTAAGSGTGGTDTSAASVLSGGIPTMLIHP